MSVTRSEWPAVQWDFRVDRPGQCPEGAPVELVQLFNQAGIGQCHRDLVCDLTNLSHIFLTQPAQRDVSQTDDPREFLL